LEWTSDAEDSRLHRYVDVNSTPKSRQGCRQL
jgi:hypothetical protein